MYDFGTFRLDERQHQLFNGDTVVPLPPKVFDTLLALVERHGQVVSRQELVDRVWGETFVEEAGLTRNISVIRKALAGNDNDQRYIETVPKRGYRFAAPVRVIAQEQTPIEPPPVLVTAQPAVAPAPVPDLPPEPVPDLAPAPASAASPWTLLAIAIDLAVAVDRPCATFIEQSPLFTGVRANAAFAAFLARQRPAS